MKLIKSSLLLWAVLCTVLSTTSCTDECEDIVCENGGTCVDGACECPEGFIGDFCEQMDIAQIQALLDGGATTPKMLYDTGVPLDSLYGKMYEGGLIFYLDTVDGSGMVAATVDQSDEAEWGCIGIDIPGLNNISSRPVNPETQEGARIGDGAANTTAILTECMEAGIAAKLCRDLGDEWFLPSRGELKLMYTNLHENGHGAFAMNGYWNSTEYNGFVAWTTVFTSGGWFDDSKFSDAHVRAARAF